MGPIALFDKSFLQSLSEEESIWFDHFFIANVCPIFYVETQADLAKEDSKWLTVEQLVERIALKFPEFSGAPNAYHPGICTAELRGDNVPMQGQIILAGGAKGSVGGHAVVIHPESPEARAFLRWTQRQFGEEERRLGEIWRNSPYGTDTSVIIDHLKKIGVYTDAGRPTLADVATEAERVFSQLTPDQKMEGVLQLLGVYEEHKLEILERYMAAGRKHLETFAPYTAFVLHLELFYHIAVHKGRMGPAQRLDMLYLCYLPFCEFFVSTDWVHRECAPFFLRDDQQFVWGADLKSALKELNGRYAALPDAESKSIKELAPKPPVEGDNLVTQIWDRHHPKWRVPRVIDSKELQEEIAWLQAQPEKLGEILASGGDPSLSPESFDVIATTRTVRRKRGRWKIVPDEQLRSSPDSSE